eukprot:TRINITY_DN67817_c4_g4_i10.p1 TRINITY_DN67817_c4_g4~~TRINITY_DN67817_c4_g4_i10.p1  ORF type:complete len:820 (-),score=62.27 TRINITY_DN67817_c4_g4_i10:2422-4881(-)
MAEGISENGYSSDEFEHYEEVHTTTVMTDEYSQPAHPHSLLARPDNKPARHRSKALPPSTPSTYEGDTEGDDFEVVKEERPTRREREGRDGLGNTKANKKKKKKNREQAAMDDGAPAKPISHAPMMAPVVSPPPPPHPISSDEDGLGPPPPKPDKKKKNSKKKKERRRQKREREQREREMALANNINSNSNSASSINTHNNLGGNSNFSTYIQNNTISSTYSTNSSTPIPQHPTPLQGPVLVTNNLLSNPTAHNHNPHTTHPTHPHAHAAPLPPQPQPAIGSITSSSSSGQFDAKDKGLRSSSDGLGPISHPASRDPLELKAIGDPKNRPSGFAPLHLPPAPHPLPPTSFNRAHTPPVASHTHAAPHAPTSFPHHASQLGPLRPTPSTSSTKPSSPNVSTRPPPGPIGGRPLPTVPPPAAPAQGNDDMMVMDDIDEDLGGDAGFVQPPPKQMNFSESSLTVGVGKGTELKQLILGKLHRFPNSWEDQGFPPSPHVPYGLTQHEGGPCGVLAVVQAFMIKHLLHDTHTATESITPDVWDAGCAAALSTILWNIAKELPEQTAYVCLPPAGSGLGDANNSNNNNASSSGMLPRIKLENFRLFSFKDYDGLKNFMVQKLGVFKASKGPGCILLVVSCILTRGGASSVRGDMDMAESSLIVEHGYCSQELVNLLLVGKAVTNVFDGSKTFVDDATGTTDQHSMHGIPHRSQVGFLTYFEHFEYFTVGEYLKTPFNPIWVVCSESHYSVLFCKQELLPDPEENSNLDLWYYDELANQDTEIRLSICTDGGYTPDEGQIPSPLEDTLRTKWKDAPVSWHGSERII